jgi:phosphate transport system substrate-binding protein
MKRFIALTVIGWAGLALLSATGCGGAGGNGKGGGPGGVTRLNGAGSSFVKPMMDEWAKLYRSEKGIEINYQSKGSSTGIEQMTNKEIDFGCSDAPMNEQQLKSAQAKGGAVVHIPLVMGAVVPVYNLEGVEKPLNFSGPLLADIFRRKITRWNAEPIKELNPGVMLPDRDIKVIHRADGSGTNYIFTEFLSKVSPEWAKEISFGTSVKWPAGTVGERGNEGVSKAVKESPGAVGYVELLYALKIKMPYGAVAALRRDKDGKPVNGKFIHADLPSVTAAAKGALTEIPADLRFSLTNAPGGDAYPISGTVWAICYVNQSPDRAQTLTNFLRWITHEGQAKAADLHYARLPAELVERIDKKLGEIKPAR